MGMFDDLLSGLSNAGDSVSGGASFLGDIAQAAPYELNPIKWDNTSFSASPISALLGLNNQDYSPMGKMSFLDTSGDNPLAVTGAWSSHNFSDGIPTDEGGSWLDKINSLIAPAQKLAESPLGKWGISGLGGLISYMDAADARDAQRKAMGSQKALYDYALARRMKADATRDKYDSPLALVNTRAASPSWGAGQQAFKNNSLSAIQQLAEGGQPKGYVSGGTTGQSDKIPALLSDGEFVMDADTVSALGDGNNAAGASALEAMRQNVRKHKRSAPVSKIPPKAKKPEQYMKGAK